LALQSSLSKTAARNSFVFNRSFPLAFGVRFSTLMPVVVSLCSVRGARPDLVGLPLWQIFASGWFYYHRRSVVAGKSGQLQQNEETLLQNIFTNLLT